MKPIVLAIAVALSFAAANAAEYVTLNVSGAGAAPSTGPSIRTFAVNPDDVLEILSFVADNPGSFGPFLTLTMRDNSTYRFVATPYRLSQTAPKFTNVQSVTLAVGRDSSSAGIATFKITRSNATSPATPSNIAVIPNDAEGDFEVVLESSVDLVTWTPINPGTFGGDTPRRFFRTRIVRRN